MSRPRATLGIAGLVFVIGIVFGSPVASLLSPGGFQDPHSESSRAADAIAAAAGVRTDRTVVALISLDAPVSAPASQAEIAHVGAVLSADPGIGAVLDASSNPALVSRGGRSTDLVGEPRPVGAKGEKDVATRLEAAFAADGHVRLGGYLIANDQVQTQVSKDLGRAELFAALILVPLMIVIFRGAVAALLPVVVGLVTIVTTFLGLRLVNEATDLSIFALNLVTGLGLGLAIDYSLLIASRYREEAAQHGHGREALRITLSTAGRTVLFSALTVAAAAASLLVFPQQFLYSMGVGGLLVTMTGAVVALTVLPATILLLGPRLDRFSVRRVRTASTAGDSGGWYRLSRVVMRRPALIAATTATLLVVMGLPFLGIRFTSVDASVLPTTASARQVSDALHTEFVADTSSPITVAVSAPPSAGSDAGALAQRIGTLPGAAQLTPPRYLGANTWEIDVFSSSSSLSSQSSDIVNAIRSLPAQHALLVGGATAQFVDLQSSLLSHLPLAIVIVASVSVVVLFALTGSLLLPIKAVLMNVLSLSAAFGLLVLIFQNGNLTGLLQYSPQGALESTQPILLFAIAFGLSTDYGVFLLSRIKEGHDSGLSTHDAVAHGLERTGRIVTAAALLFCVAIGVFATSSIVFIKELGVGTALAVIIDASIVRAFLVPSLMALLREWNWWAPGPLRRLHRRLRLDRFDTQGDPAQAA